MKRLSSLEPISLAFTLPTRLLPPSMPHRIKMVNTLPILFACLLAYSGMWPTGLLCCLPTLVCLFGQLPSRQSRRSANRRRNWSRSVQRSFSFSKIKPLHRHRVFSIPTAGKCLFARSASNPVMQGVQRQRSVSD